MKNKVGDGAFQHFGIEAPVWRPSLMKESPVAVREFKTRWPSVSTVVWKNYYAALFDLDGVLTPTTNIHMRAWFQMFNDFLSARGVDQSYTDDDYFTYVDGKPRYEGVAAFLASRGIEMTTGDPTDLGDQETVCGLGNRKNTYFNEILARDGIEPYPGSLRLIQELRDLRLPMAVVSSSQNAMPVLAAAGITELFEHVVDGRVAKQLGLPGKPAPDCFLHAAQLLAVPPAKAVVLEDAISGVAAGHAGGFGLVIGINRGAGAQALRDAGANLVVDDCEELRP